MIGFPSGTMLVFAATVVALLVVDSVWTGQPHALPLRSALWRSALYVAAACAFGGYVFVAHGAGAASKFFSGYAMEKALSVDNLIAFVAVFSYFGITPPDQPRILRWGMLGAIGFRLLFVSLGAGSLTLFGRPVEAAFGLAVGWSAIAMLRSGSEDGEAVDHESRWYARVVRNLFPVDYSVTSAFFTRSPYTTLAGVALRTRRTAATRALLCLVAIEVTDVLFSFDSVPTVIAVTQDPLLVYSAMIFAILGLRALYLVLDAMRRYLVHLDKAVVCVLFFIASKLLVHAAFGWEITPGVSLVVVLALLALGVLASALAPRWSPGEGDSAES